MKSLLNEFLSDENQKAKLIENLKNKFHNDFYNIEEDIKEYVNLVKDITVTNKIREKALMQLELAGEEGINALLDMLKDKKIDLKIKYKIVDSLIFINKLPVERLINIVEDELVDKSIKDNIIKAFLKICEPVIEIFSEYKEETTN